jgi:REJ domain
MFGAECEVSPIGYDKSTLTIPPNKLKAANTYAFVVLVSAKDGRSSSQTVIVTPVGEGSAQLNLLSSFVQFNPGSKLVIESNIYAQFNVSAFWTVSSSLGKSVAFSSLTPSEQNFTKINAMQNVHFPLSVPAYSFHSGASYTFRLTVYPYGKASLATFAEVVLRANAPPSGGFVIVNPQSGIGLSTNFTITSPGFTTDVSAFPLSYSFTYAVSQSSPKLTITAASVRAFAVTNLPAGLPSLFYMINVTSEATDIFLSSATAFRNVTVTSSSTVNVTRILTTGLIRAFSSGNVNLAFQIVNNVSFKSMHQQCDFALFRCSIVIR